MQPPPRHLGLDALRGFVTLLVIAHHAVLAYHPFAPPPPSLLSAPPQMWRAFPVVDDDRWSGFMWLVGWNDSFFMALMFFLAGLFVWDGLERRGAAGYVRRRVLRLGLPFAVAAGVLAPFAYFPTYLQTGAPFDVVAFFRQWLAAGDWASGPAWFLWLLLAYDLLAAALFALRARLPGGVILGHPFGSFVLLVLLGGVLYVPLALEVGAMSWSAFGPFQLQTSRVLHHAVYFFGGVAVGAHGIQRSFLAPGGALARRWPAWLAAAIACFAVGVFAVLRSFAGGQAWTVVAVSSLVFTCATSCFALLAIFVRFANRPSRVWGSLAANQYGIYLLHYVVVAWLQLAFLPAPRSGFQKGVMVTALAILLSWGAAASSRFLVAPRRPIFG